MDETMIITIPAITSIETCKEGLELCLELWPNGVPITVEAALAGLQRGVKLDWWKRYLTDESTKLFLEIEKPAHRVYSNKCTRHYRRHIAAGREFFDKTKIHTEAREIYNKIYAEALVVAFASDHKHERGVFAKGVGR